MSIHALVVGSTSMVGSELVRQLRVTNVEVITSSRSAGDAPYDLSSLAAPPALRLRSVDVVFICSSSFFGDDPDGCIQNAIVNAAAMHRLAEWASRLSSPYVLIAGTVSSHAPSSSYGLSKALGWEILEWEGQRRGFQTTGLQFPQLCDDHGLCARHQPWFARIVRRASAGEDLRLAPNDQPRNFLHAADAARAMIVSWQQGLTGNHAMTAPEYATYRDIADLAYQVFDKGGTVIEAHEMKPFRQSSYPPASTSAWALMGESRVSLKDTFQRIKSKGTANYFIES